MNYKYCCEFHGIYLDAELIQERKCFHPKDRGGAGKKCTHLKSVKKTDVRDFSFPNDFLNTAEREINI